MNVNMSLKLRIKKFGMLKQAFSIIKSVEDSNTTIKGDCVAQLLAYLVEQHRKLL